MATTFAVVAICLNCREYSGWIKSYRVLVRTHTACLKYISFISPQSLSTLEYYYDLFFAFVT